MLQVGVIGLGVGMRHVEAFNAHPECTVKAACDFDAMKLDEVHRACPDIATTGDASELLDDQEIDIISIASYDNFHCAQVLAAIESGKHVFVEKPLCLTRSELEMIAESLRAHPGIHFSSNLPLRTAPRFVRVRDALKQGAFGPVYHFEGDYYWGRKEKLTAGWRAEMDFYSIIHGACVHLVDLVVWLTGQWPDTVYAAGNAIATQDSGTRFNDFSVLVVSFPNGMTAKITGHGGCVHHHHHRVAVFGRDKTFFNEDNGAKWFESCNVSESPIQDDTGYPAKEERGNVITSFVTSVLHAGTAPLVTAQDAIHVMDICLAAEESLDDRQVKQITYTKM